VSAVLITGATGFIGSHLAAALSARGHRVVGTTTRTAPPPAGVERLIPYRLGQPIDRSTIGRVDAVVHAAWDIRRGTAAANLDGTRRVEAAAGDAFQLFVGSYSAHPDAVTEYGAAKYQMQQEIAGRGGAVTRLGITIGNGGIYKRIAETATRYPLVPVVDGEIPVPVLAVADFVRAAVAILEGRMAGVFNLYDEALIPLRDVIRAICEVHGRSPVLVGVPGGLVLGPLRLAAAVGIRLPLDADNVRALRANRGRRDPSDLRTLVPQPMTLAEMVRAAASG
jgi:nucleoside-diphosphate-sugar epimerase